MIQDLDVGNDLTVSHMGPSLDEGRKPALFYFALSAHESLTLDPFNQPVAYLQKAPLHIFSVDLPAHGEGKNAIDAIGVWAKEFERGHDPLTPFIEKTLHAIEVLIDRGYVNKEMVGLAGLSRGGLLALHLAARLPKVRGVVGYAPLTKLSAAKEFDGKFGEHLNAEHLIDHLYDKAIRFYMGNRDIRTGTRTCFEFIESLANTAFDSGVRSPPSELILSPSIGHMGHGTTKESFEAGAQWIGRRLGVIK